MWSLWILEDGRFGAIDDDSKQIAKARFHREEQALAWISVKNKPRVLQGSRGQSMPDKHYYEENERGIRHERHTART